MMLIEDRMRWFLKGVISFESISVDVDENICTYFLYEGEAYSIRRVKREKYDKKCRKADKVVDVGIRRLYNYIDTWGRGK